MFLIDYINIDSKDGKQISKLARESSTFNKFYEYRRDELFERIMRLFVWEGGWKYSNAIDGLEAWIFGLRW